MAEESVARNGIAFPRVYVASAILADFRGHRHVEVQLFRANASDEELEQLRGLKLVAAPDSSIPKEVLAGANEEAALKFILEAFTKEEIALLQEYLEKRFGRQIEKLEIGEIALPVPFGVSPLGQIPETSMAGFIHFDKAADYPLSFAVRGYYDLEA